VTCEFIKRGDLRKSGLLLDWEAWLQSADILYSRSLKAIGYSPFEHHEVSSVGLLAAAAAMAGFTPVMEYEHPKEDRRGDWGSWNGRADLWFSSGTRSYSIEAKRAYWKATATNLEKVLVEAHSDAECVAVTEYNYAAGLLIALVVDPLRIETYTDFAEREDVSLAARIGPAGQHGAYLYFKFVEPKF
jgi:hypothetical protein